MGYLNFNIKIQKNNIFFFKEILVVVRKKILFECMIQKEVLLKDKRCNQISNLMKKN